MARFQILRALTHSDLYKDGVQVAGPIPEMDCIEFVLRNGEDADTLVNEDWAEPYRDRTVGVIRAERIKYAKELSELSGEPVCVDSRGLYFS